MAMNHRLLRPLASQSLADADAATYLAAVEAADGQSLEPAVRNAITAFVVGCKSDGIWGAIKASCILMGARTLAGALTPLVGSAPTNNGPFVSGDYARGGATPGLKGDGSGKYLDSNRAHNADDQDDRHFSHYASVLPTVDDRSFIGCGGSGAGASNNYRGGSGANFDLFFRNVQGSSFLRRTGSSAHIGFMGSSRSSSGAFTARTSKADQSVSSVSQTPLSNNYFVFSDQNPATLSAIAITDARIAFYSIGESLDLALLDTRVSSLVTAISEALP